MSFRGSWFALALFLSVLVGCDDDPPPASDAAVMDLGDLDAATDAGAPDQPSDEMPPWVLTTSPIASARGVETSPLISVAFVEPIDPASLNASTFGLTASNGEQIAGTVTSGPNGGQFRPTLPLAFDAQYTATVTNQVTDVAGNQLQAEASWSFSVRSARWPSGAISLEEDPPPSTAGPALAVDEEGVATVAWTRDVNGGELRAVRVVDGVAQAPFTIATGGAMHSVRVAAGPAGDAIVAWIAGDDVFARRHTSARGWEDTDPLQTGVADGALGLQLAMNHAGKAAVAWRRPAPVDDIWGATYDPATGWASAEALEAARGNNVSDPALAIDGFGVATVAWIEDDGATWAVAARRHTSTAWVRATILDTTGSEISDLLLTAGAGDRTAVGWTTNDVFEIRIIDRERSWFDPGRSFDGFSVSREALAVRFDGDLMELRTDANGASARLFAAGEWNLRFPLGDAVGSPRLYAHGPDGFVAIYSGSSFTDRSRVFSSTYGWQPEATLPSIQTTDPVAFAVSRQGRVLVAFNGRAPDGSGADIFFFQQE